MEKHGEYINFHIIFLITSRGTPIKKEKDTFIKFRILLLAGCI